MPLELFHWVALALCLYCSLVLFRDLGDVSQWWLKLRRSRVMETWRNRRLYLAAAVLSGALAIWTSLLGAGATPLMVAALGAAALFIFIGYFNPGWSMRANQHAAEFVPIEAARGFIPRRQEVLVVAIGDEARAYADYEIWRPHIVGNDEGVAGRDVAMTYCALSNVGIAYEPRIDGEAVDLHVMSQLQNNLLMWDARSDEPIQHLWGRREGDGPNGPRMKEFASFKMPFEKFERAYPHGKVFRHSRVSAMRNPLLALYDLVWDAAFYMVINRQKQLAEPVFPTIERPDPRLPLKEQVWGFNIGDDYVCFSLPYLLEKGGLLNVTVGDERVAVHWDPDFESVGIWRNSSGEDVRSLDFFGVSNAGRLERVETVKAGCFFGMWAAYYPQTDVDRVDAAPS